MGISQGLASQRNGEWLKEVIYPNPRVTAEAPRGSRRIGSRKRSNLPGLDREYATGKPKVKEIITAINAYLIEFNKA